MKLLLGFVAACVLLLATTAWFLVDFEGPPAVGNVPGASSIAPPVSSAGRIPPEQSPPPGPFVSDEAEHAALVTDEAPPSDFAPPPFGTPNTSEVRWVSEPAMQRAVDRLAAARTVLADDPDHPLALRDACEALTVLRRWPELADALARLRRIRPDDDALTFEHATVLMRLRRWMEGLPLLKRLVERQPDDCRAWFNLAVTHQALGQLADARRAWDRTIALRPDAAALARRGEVLLDLREWAAAAADFQTVLLALPDSPDAVLNLALAWWRMGQVDEARAGLRDWLTRHPRHVPALNRLAEIAWTVCRSDPATHTAACREATACWQQSLEIDPHQPEISKHLEAVRMLLQPSH